LTLYTLNAQLDGDLEPLVSALASEEAAKKLTEGDR
jgi:hypothetical protein